MTSIYRSLTQKVRRLNAARQKQYQGHNYTLFWSGNQREKVGIYTYGACDVGAVFALEPFIKQDLRGMCCIYRGGYGAASARSDIILQTVRQWPESVLSPMTARLKINPGYFQPHLFDPAFHLVQGNKAHEFAKNVIILSIGPDLVRQVYRHKESGLLVDPGGWWLNQNMNLVLDDLDTVRWFRQTFVKMGRISVADSLANFTKIINLIRSRTSARIIVFNMLTVEPGGRDYNFQLVKDPLVLRRRKFDVAVRDLSQQLDFSILDVDRILKGIGINEQVDFGHWPLDRFKPVAKALYRILLDLDVLPTV